MSRGLVSRTRRSVSSFARSLRAKLVTRLSSKPRPTQSAKCTILQKLPTEIIFTLMPHLSDLDKVILAQTCSQMRRILYSPGRPSSERAVPILTPRQHTQYLAITSRDHLDLWACEKCHELHKFKPKDTIGASSPVKCRRREDRLLGDDWLRYRHAQMALKLHRHQDNLTSKQRAYYEALHRGIKRDDLELFPRIVQGRLLIKYARSLQGNEWENPCLLSNYRGGLSWAICPHSVLWQASSEPMKAPEKSQKAAQGSCAHCPTDYTVYVHPTGVASVYTWVDLGGEMPMTDGVWAMYRPNSNHVSKFATPGNDAELPLSVDMSPTMNVKDLYESVGS